MTKKKKRIIKIRYPTSLDELVSMVKRVTPVVGAVTVSFVALTVVGYRETIMSMEFDPSLTGMLIWILMVRVAAGGLK